MSAARVYATVRLAVDVDGLASGDLVGDVLHDALVSLAVLDSIREHGIEPDQLEWETEADALSTQGCEETGYSTLLWTLRQSLERTRDKGPAYMSDPAAPEAHAYLRGRRQGLDIAIGLIEDLAPAKDGAR